MVDGEASLVTREPDADHDAQTPGKPRELALSAAWHGTLVPSLMTVEGQRIDVVFAGHWTHGFGPDFEQAMLVFPDGTLATGAVEIHQRTGEWIAHGHHVDPRYNEVILHVVGRHDGAETRRADGALVPVAVLPVASDRLRQIDRRLPAIWDRLGGAVCAEGLTRRRPAEIRGILHRLGDERLAQRVATYESDLTAETPAATLHRAWFDALGYTENRSPMRALAASLPPARLAALLASPSPERRTIDATALLLGLGGFLPLAPADAAVAHVPGAAIGRIEARWSELRTDLTDAPVLTPTAWQRGRVRPANHPALRLAQAASVLSSTHGDLLSLVVEALRSSASLPEAIQHSSSGADHPPIGDDRAIAMTASVFIPFAVAYANHTGDAALLDAAASAWEDLPASGRSRPVKRALRQVAGESRLGGLGERGQQGLLLLDRSLCTQRRCFECPIARAVAADEATRDGQAVGEDGARYSASSA